MLPCPSQPAPRIAANRRGAVPRPTSARGKPGEPRPRCTTCVHVQRSVNSTSFLDGLHGVRSGTPQYTPAMATKLHYRVPVSRVHASRRRHTPHATPRSISFLQIPCRFLLLCSLLSSSQALFLRPNAFQDELSKAPPPLPPPRTVASPLPNVNHDHRRTYTSPPVPALRSREMVSLITVLLAFTIRPCTALFTPHAPPCPPLTSESSMCDARSMRFDHIGVGMGSCRLPSSVVARQSTFVVTPPTDRQPALKTGLDNRVPRACSSRPPASAAGRRRKVCQRPSTRHPLGKRRRRTSQR